MISVSTASCVITPDRPCYMGGYAYRTVKSIGAHDDLLCNALVIKNNDTPIVLCSLDILLVYKELVDDIKAQVSKKHGVKPENIIIAAIHTHGAPEMRDERLPVLNDVPDEKYSDIFKQMIIERTVETIDRCFEAGFEPARAEYRVVNVEGFYGNRTYADKPGDKSVALVRFVSGGKVLGGFFNISCHPTVLGQDNLFITGDLLGYLGHKLSLEWGVNPVIVQGSAGDMSNRHFRKGHDFAELERTGNGIYEQLKGGEYLPLEIGEPKNKGYHYHAEFDIDVEYFKKLKASLEEQLENETEFDRRKIVMSSITGTNLRLAHPHMTADFDYSVHTLGELQLICLPGELFSRFGQQIKAASNAKLPLIWCYADGYGGYMLGSEDYGVTYEGTMALIPQGATEEITAELCRIVSELK